MLLNLKKISDNTVGSQENKKGSSNKSGQSSLKAQMINLKLSFFRHIMLRPSSLEEAVILGKVERMRRKGRPSADHQMDLVTMVMSTPLEDLKDQLRDGLP